MCPPEFVRESRAGVSTDRIAHRRAVGVVGPNAVLQLVDPLREAGGDDLVSDIFSRARVFHYLQQPPLAMVPEEQARRLFDAALARLGSEAGDVVLRAAGRGTAHYVMRHRIPAFARGLLRTLPAPLSAPMLLNAIRANAWTFAGSGACETGKTGDEWQVTIGNNPLATPGCPWHLGVLETMFQTLVSRRISVSHEQCCAWKGSCCRFDLRMS